MLLSAVLGTGSAVADDVSSTPYQESSFSARAWADGFRVTLGAPGRFAVGEFADAGYPVAQAVLDSLGTSKAFASAPYPGDNVIAGPGTFAGFTGLPNPGEYPFYVSSSYPATPEGKFTQPGATLDAHSDEQSSKASAVMGGASKDANVLMAAANGTAARDATGNLVAESHSRADAIQVGPLSIAGIRASARVTKARGADLARETTFEAVAVSIAGQPVSITPKGVVLAGSGAPLPDGSPALKALEAAGITVQYLQAVKTEAGVISPGLLIVQTTRPPDGGPKMTLQLSFGRAVAQVVES